MQFTLGDSLICYTIENGRRASQDAQVPCSFWQQKQMTQMTKQSDGHQNHQDHPISKRSRARFPSGPLQFCCACRLWAVGLLLLLLLLWLQLRLVLLLLLFLLLVCLFVCLFVAVAVAVAVAVVAAAAAFGGASGHAAGPEGSSSGAGAIKWCCCQCISATTGAGGVAVVGTDVVL